MVLLNTIHLDIDILDPTFFRSLYITEPGLTEYPAASGKNDTGRII